MILDTSYFLPLARIDVNSDVLLAVAERRISSDKVSLDSVGLNFLSIFELQAKAAKLRVKTEYVIEAVEKISRLFKVVPHTADQIIETGI